MSQIRHAAWSVRADTISAERLCSVFNCIARQWVFQQERGDSGEELFIAYAILKSRIRIHTLVRDLVQIHGMSRDGLTIAAIEEPYLKDHPVKLYRFQTRNERYIAGPWSNDAEPVIEAAPVPVVDMSTYSPWQHQIWHSCVAEPREPHINLVVDHLRQMGRTTLIHDIESSRRGLCLMHSDSSRNMQHWAYLRLRDYSDPKCLLIVIPSSSTLSRGTFEIIENLKSGICKDTRGRIRQHTFATPIIWVFCDNTPSRDFVTPPLWKSWQVDMHSNLVEFDIPAPPSEPSRPNLLTTGGIRLVPIHEARHL